MVNIIEVRKVTEDVLLFVWFKNGSLLQELERKSNIIPDISDELMNNLSVSVWIESFRTKYIWDDFFKKHFKRMTSSSKLFANYLAYACYFLNESPNAYECFVDILSIASEFSIRCLEGDCLNYVNTCVELFCAFFTNELHKNFNDQGGWKKFNEYIGKKYVMQIKSMMSEEIPPAYLYEYFQDAAFETENQPEYEVGGVVLKKTKPYYIVNGFNLKDITHEEVESHEKARDFAESIMDKIEKLLQKTFEELMMDFRETEFQLKDLYRREDEELFDEMKSEDRPFQIVKNSKRKPKSEPRSFREVQQSSVGMENKEEQPKIGKESSDERKRQIEQCSSRKVQDPPVGSNGVKREDEELFDEMKSEDRPFQIVKNSKRKPKSDSCSFLEVQQSSVGMENKEGQPKLGKESSDDRKRQSEQCSSGKVQDPAVGSKGVQRIKDQESFGGRKNQMEQYSCQKGQKISGGKKDKGAKRTKDADFSDGINSQAKCYSEEFPKLSAGVKSKETPRRKNNESSAGIENQVKQGSSEVPKPHTRLLCKETLRRKDKESFGKIENQGKQGSSREVPEYSNALQIKDAQERKYTKTSGGKKNEEKNQSQNVKEASEITSCEAMVTKKELDVKTVTPQNPFKSQNLDNIKLQDSVTPVQSSNLKQESSKTETTKKLLRDMSNSIRQVYQFMQSLCEKHGVQVPAHLQLNNNT